MLVQRLSLLDTANGREWLKAGAEVQQGSKKTRGTGCRNKAVSQRLFTTLMGSLIRL
jgi:hypothetical protein